MLNLKRFLKNLLPFNGFSAEDKEKAEALSKIRREPVEEIYRKFGNKINNAPLKFNRHTSKLFGYDFTEAGIKDGMAYIKLSNGRTFYGYRSHKKLRKEYEFLKDRVSPVLNADTYLTALDVSSRYPRYPKELLPGKGGVIVEAGAYLGHKTIRFIDDVVGTMGKVLAIEMMPDNYRMLRRNIQANDLGSCINVINCGVWSSSGETEVMGKDGNVIP